MKKALLRETIEHLRETIRAERATVEACEARATNAGEMLCTLRKLRPETADQVGAILCALGAYRWIETSPPSREDIR